ncbi:MAG TPA: glycosyltransferase family 4 protein [Woeseiaceae bacterium]|nr:glycosyltransferase family 4 protein [Woeseiaceae bacterium]
MAVAALLLSACIAGLMKVYARRAKLLDVPNERSSHQVVTARGGGLSIAVVFLGAIIWLYVFDNFPTDAFYSLLVGGVLVAGIGFVDDHRHVSAKWRILVHLFAAVFAIVILGGFPEIQFGSKFVDMGIVGDAMAILFTIWFINLYNFMDGIDGIAAVEALSICASVLLILFVGDGGYFANLLVVLGAATLGFLIWNWPPAKIFMGDVGSGFVGFILAAIAIISSIHGNLPIWCWLILAGVFVVDSTVTLFTRVMKGEKWYSAHNTHAYQKASRRLGSHRAVTLSVLVINVGWLMPIAWLASVHKESGWWLTAGAWLPLVLISLHYRAGRPDPAN